jgi:hypothetical protein
MTTPAPPPSKERNSLQVRIPRELYERLAPLRGPGETIGDVLRRLLGHDDTSKPADLS